MGGAYSALKRKKIHKYTDLAFRQYYSEIGVKLGFSSAHTPQQIDANRRIGRTLAGVVLCVLAYSGQPHFVLGERVQTAIILRNRVPRSALSSATSCKTLHGNDPPLGHLRAIVARAFVHLETHVRKLEPRDWEGRLLEHSLDSTSVCILSPEKQNERISRNVIIIKMPPAIAKPDLDSVSAFEEGKFMHDEHDDLVRDMRHYTSGLDFCTPAFETTTTDASTLDFANRTRESTDRDLGGTAASPVSSSAVVVHLLPRPPVSNRLQPVRSYLFCGSPSSLKSFFILSSQFIQNS